MIENVLFCSTRYITVRSLCRQFRWTLRVAWCVMTKASIFEPRVFLSNHKGDIEDSDLRSRQGRGKLGLYMLQRSPCGGDLKRGRGGGGPPSTRREEKREKEKERSGERWRLYGRDGDPLRQDIGQDLAVDSRSFPSDSRALFLPIPRPDRHKTQVTPVFMPVVFTPVATLSRRPAPRSPLIRAPTPTHRRETRIYIAASPYGPWLLAVGGWR